ncbi:MAG: RluA family pseudouridine synthase [Rickettsiaceae bacterium]|nr:RluA family pseudouridine synthase [Rickettsiaceae bacterium]
MSVDNYIQIKVLEQIPVRLDRYLKRLYPKLTQGLIEQFLRKKLIRVNNAKSQSNLRITNQDIILIAKYLIPKIEDNKSDKQEFPPSVIALANKIMGDYLIYDSPELIAINKPVNLAVQGGSKIKVSIDDAISYLNSKDQDNEQLNLKLVHRLDKNTSGVLVIAKGYENSSKIAAAFKARLIKKKYLAILSKMPLEKEGIISNYIAKNGNTDKQVVSVVSKEEGRLAETKYKILDINQNNGYCLVEFIPLTGRMHQLRVHSKYLGSSIVGDLKYGNIKHARMLLHAASLIIPASVFGKEITINADIDEDFFQ